MFNVRHATERGINIPHTVKHTATARPRYRIMNFFYFFNPQDGYEAIVAQLKDGPIRGYTTIQLKSLATTSNNNKQQNTVPKY